MGKQAFSNNIIDLQTLQAKQGVRFLGDKSGDQSGSCVRFVGDFNRDGYGDLGIGAPYASPAGRSFAGKVYLAFGKKGLSGTIDLRNFNKILGIIFEGEKVSDLIGRTLGSVGDLDGDGYGDFGIGVSYADPDGQSMAGVTFLVYGGERLDDNWVYQLANLTTMQSFRVQGEGPGDYSGYALGTAGDFNKDGQEDFFVTAPYADPAGKSGAGVSYVIYVGSNYNETLKLANLTTTQGLRIRGKAPNDFSGFSMNAVGDVNGDEIDDLMLGAYGTDFAGKANAGEVVVIFGKPGLNGTLDLTSLTAGEGAFIQGEGINCNTGWSVDGIDDFNRDSLKDMAVGAPNADPAGRLDAGKTYVVFGRRSWLLNLDLGSLIAEEGLTIEGEAAGDLSGSSVAKAGDFNDDGYSDVIIGAWRSFAGRGSFTGKAYIVFGGQGLRRTLNLANLTAEEGVVIRGAAAYDSSGFSVGPAGDLNGDMVCDVAVGAPNASPQGRSLAGETYVIFGNAAPEWVNYSLAIIEGTRVNITSNDIFVSDKNHSPSALLITPSELSHGQFERLNQPGITLASFTQADVNAGDIQFVPDGSKISPAFMLTVSDGVGFNGPVSAEINFNTAPYLNNPLPDQQAAIGEPFNMTIGNTTFTDVDSSNLTYSAQQSDGAPLSSSWLQFIPEEARFTGIPERADVGNLQVNVTATDQGNLSAMDSFVVTTQSLLSATGLNQEGVYTEDTEYDFADLVVSTNQPQVTVTEHLLDPSVGQLLTGTAGNTTATFNATTGTWQARGSVEEVNTALGELHFVPTQDAHQPCNISVDVEDGVNIPLSGVLELEGLPVNDPPYVAQPLDDQQVTVGEPFQIDIKANTTFVDPDHDDPLNLSVKLEGGTNLPAGMDFDSQTGMLSGTLPNPGTLLIEVIAQDLPGLNISDSFALTAVEAKSVESVTEEKSNSNQSAGNSGMSTIALVGGGLGAAFLLGAVGFFARKWWNKAATQNENKDIPQNGWETIKAATEQSI